MDRTTPSIHPSPWICMEDRQTHLCKYTEYNYAFISYKNIIQKTNYNASHHSSFITDAQCGVGEYCAPLSSCWAYQILLQDPSPALTRRIRQAACNSDPTNLKVQHFFYIVRMRPSTLSPSFRVESQVDEI